MEKYLTEDTAKKAAGWAATFALHTVFLWVAIYFATSVFENVPAETPNIFELTGLTALLYALRAVFRNEAKITV